MTEKMEKLERDMETMNGVIESMGKQIMDSLDKNQEEESERLNSLAE